MDLTGWYDKRTAAQIMGVSEKTIDRMAGRKQIRRQIRKEPRPARPMFHPEDVQKHAATREETAMVPLRRPQDHPVIGLLPEHLQNLIDAAMRLGTDQGRSQALSELKHKVFLTTSEALRLSGLSRRELSDMVVAGRITRIGSGRHKYRRSDLEAL